MTADEVDYAEFERAYDEGRLDDAQLAAALSDAWTARYSVSSDKAELVEVDQGALTYLFDVHAARIVGVYGRSVPTTDPRPAARMRGFPLPSSPAGLVRGHLVAHTIGGGTDINLIPQDARLNLSNGWRRLERLAGAHPGCFIAIEAAYDDATQTPARLTYVVAADGKLVWETFSNR